MVEPRRVSPSEPLDPLTRRPDDPWIGRWWWWARRLYGRDGRRRVFGRLVVLTLMAALVSLVAFAVVRWVRG